MFGGWAVNHSAGCAQYLCTCSSLLNTRLTGKVVLILPHSLVDSYSITPKAELTSSSAPSKHSMKSATSSFKCCAVIVCWAAVFSTHTYHCVPRAVT